MRAFVLTLLFYLPLFAIEVPFLSGPVVDEVRFFSQNEKAQIESALHEFKIKNNVQMTVLVPTSLQGLEIEQYSIEVTDKWRLGKKGQDKGLLLIIAPKERRLRLEVGYGLEGDFPDAIAKRIISTILTPALKAKRPAEGVLQVINYAEARLQKLEGSESPTEYQGGKKPGLSAILMILLFFIFIFFKAFLFPRFPGGGMGGGSGWGGGGLGGGGFGGGFGGGGGWSGGGGGFGGGGASGRW